MAVRQSIRKLLVQGFGIATVPVAAMAAAPAAQAGAIYPVSDPDGFYYAAGNLDAAQNGDAPNARLVPYHPWPGATVWQLLLHSIAPACAPELPIVGVAEGGAPANPGKMAIQGRNRIANSCVDDIISVGANQVPLDLALDTAGRYCAAGTPVQFGIIPGADHDTAILPGAAIAMNYLSDRFAGLAPPSDCR
ncbi:hypothetical protein [Nocardia sp. NPDC046763]|uniref:hypothetical protein n=1 Tax=Nocardia sp. NPDC046763 TaxID=3155256 RepID=UPI00340885BE